MRKVGIVGNGTDKFTETGKARAMGKIAFALTYPEDADVLISGHSPVGGIDIWAEEAAKGCGIKLDIKTPEIQQWNPPGGYGYKARNLDIARDSDEVHVILAADYPPDYKGHRFKECYHCKAMGRNATDHVKSGACWTAKQALSMGKTVVWHIVDNG